MFRSVYRYISIDEIIEYDRKTIFPNREEIEKIVKDKIMKQLLNN
jgi:hypothetical protein